jgi:NAD(P)-dependent dehydrogenase (short-subunit alcohol dehydrogenase family)
MPSAHWDEARAEAYRRFVFEFPDRELAGKTVVLAGGSGGLGAAAATLLAREGANLVIGYRTNRERAEGLRDALQRQFHARIELVSGDIADAGVRNQFSASIETLGAPLAGAAIFPGDPARVSFENLNRESMESSLQANYVGPILLAKDLGHRMEVAGGGSIVLLATMQALAAFQSSLNYAAPKAALVHAARILAQQWNRVRVNVVAPGATIAGMATASVQAGKYDRFVESGAITRFGRPEDVARAVRFFLEPDNYLTGQVVAVDGGLTLRRDRG